MSLTAINSHLKRFVPGVTRDDGWWICVFGLGSVAVAIHQNRGFDRVPGIAYGILVAMTGLRFATKGMVELWIAYSWLSFFAVRFVFDTWLFDQSNFLGGCWSLVFDATCAACCAAFITHGQRTFVISKEQD